MDKLVDVEQCDREMAAQFRPYVGETVAGLHDDYPLVQAFARHRIASQSRPSLISGVEAEKLARELLAKECPDSKYGALIPTRAAVAAIVEALSPVRGWQESMADAPRDGQYILAIVAPGRGRHLEHQAGRVFVIRHEGETAGYDMGWAVYPGFGGASDHDFTHWQPLPTPPADREGGR